MVKKIAINGFGRIGRQVLRQALEHEDLEIVAINDLTDAQNLAYLLRYDSAHGKFNKIIELGGDHLKIEDHAIRILSEKNPENLPWKKLGIDIVIESTGRFRTKETAGKHLTAGAKKVLLSAPGKSDGIKTIVMGVNEHEYDENKDHIVSNASCTTNCLAPIVKVINDNFEIEEGLMTTIHSYTNDQRILDLPHKDLRRGRSAGTNIIPTTTGASIAVSMVIPSLKGKLAGMAIRVPTPCGSITDFVCKIKNPATKEGINTLFREVSQSHLKGILEYTEEPIVLTDIINNPHSCIFDGGQTMLVGEKFLKVFGWYDNEWGYSARMVDVLKIM